VRQEVEHMRRLVPGGRRLQIGLRVNVIVRDTEREAWRAADTLISKADAEIVSLVAERSRSSSPSRPAHHQLTRRADLTVGPNLWAGVGTVRFGVAVSLVGSPEQVVERLMEYRGAGVDFFILSGFPHLAEAARAGELVVRLRQEENEPLSSSSSQVTSP
jgi:alkanesulfonate monooxygenase